MSEIVTKINADFENQIKKINNIDLSDATDQELTDFALDLRKDAKSACLSDPSFKINEIDEFIVQAFALVKEAALRKLGLKAYDEQLWAALVLNKGALVEMATGEGKTLAAVFPAFLNSLTGKGVHVLTFNDYLAKRDAKTMKPVYNLLGTDVDYLYEGQPFKDRKKAYNSDITYMTAKECGFDYLKDFLVDTKDELLLPELNYAIIDEADSILIDEARIPLVIAATTTLSHTVDLTDIENVVRKLIIGSDYMIDEYENNIYLTEDGIESVERLLGIENLYDENNLDTIVCINHALHAKELLKRDVDYIVRNDTIELVDEFTGRIALKRHWPHGLHEAIEVKEGLAPSKKGQILSQITLQDFIRLYKRLAGMTGTATSAAPEFMETYNLAVHRIPTHAPMIRNDKDDLLYTHREAKVKAIIKKIQEAYRIGRPVLIGTVSVEESEELAEMLKILDLPCQILNAKNDEMEAMLIAAAGKPYTLTVSTNMAGRGIDIRLGGIDEKDRNEVVDAGGLLVIGTNRHESLRIDNQLRGRAGRQGDPGESQFFISIEDDLFIKYNFKELLPAKAIPVLSDSPITDDRIIRESLRLQRIVEGQHFDMRSALSKYTVMLQEQSEYIRNMRYRFLTQDFSLPIYFKDEAAERYFDLCKTYGTEFVHKIERKIVLRVINQCWADYLENMSFVKDSIHILKMSGKDPLLEYNRILFDSFYDLKTNIHDQIISLLQTIPVDENGIDLESQGFPKPASTWTYISSNSAEQTSLFPFLESLSKITKKHFFE
ncbi:MAG: preprotein translocase subunit SecA [Saccharofermentanales bacterium]